MLLRPMVESDLEFMLEIRNEVLDLIKDNRVFSLDEAIEWYHAQQPENYVICAEAGDVGIMRVRRAKQHDRAAEVGGDIHQDYRRRGFGRRAYNVLIPYLLELPSVNELFLEVLEINMPAFNLYHELGFEIHVWEPEMAKREEGYLAGFIMNLTQAKWERK